MIIREPFGTIAEAVHRAVDLYGLRRPRLDPGEPVEGGELSRWALEDPPEDPRDLRNS